MSHFDVLVIGEDVEKQLAPFHEFECTGVNDEFVQNIDITDKVRDDFSKYTISMIKMPDGSMLRNWDDIFYREPTEEEKKIVGIGGTGFSSGISFTSKDWGDGLGYRTKIHYIPEGCEEVEVPHNDFRTYVEDYEGKKVVPFGERPDISGIHKYGYATLDQNGNIVKIIDRTNPNAKWDWYQIGGRYSGHFQLKDKSKGDLGSPSLLMIHDGYKGVPEGFCDSAKKKDIDFDSMRKEAQTKAREEWNKVHTAIGNLGKWKSFEDVRGEVENIEEARKIYHSQSQVIAIKELFPDRFFLRAEQYLADEEEYVLERGNSAISTYAVIKDGKWYQKGEMGWFGMSSGDMSDEEWNTEFGKLIDSIDGDTRLTVIDCHI